MTSTSEDVQRRFPQPLHFDWTPPTDWEKVAEDWLVLETAAQPEVFLTWDWVATWQAVYGQTSHVCRVYAKEQLVAMGLWVLKRHERPLGFHTNTLHLQHCGDEQRDQIWPEYNELLCLPAYREVVHRQVLQQLPLNESINEVDFGVSDTALTSWLCCHDDWLAEQRWDAASIGVKLLHYPSFPAYVSSLSKSFQYQLRRTEKGLLNAGETRIQFAPDLPTCLTWFHEDAVWHKAQWGEQSGFKNQHFVDFHHAWIERAFPKQRCQYVRLMVGQEAAAGAYLLATAQNWYFYLGFAREDWGPKVKTGYYLHLKLIEQCFSLGLSHYDFMGGDYPYKRRFGEPLRHLAGNRYKPINWVNRCEQGLKRLKRCMGR